MNDKIKKPTFEEAKLILYIWTHHTVGCYTPAGFDDVLKQLGFINKGNAEDTKVIKDWLGKLS